MSHHLRTSCMVLAFGLLLLPIGVSAARASVESPTAVVEHFHAVLLETMKNSERMGFDGRYEELAPVIRQTFDLDFMAQKSVGRHWKSLDDAAKQQWLDTFVRLSIANYAARFDDYTGENFESLGEEPAAHDTTVVRTVLRLQQKDDVHLNYRLRETADGWRVVDVYLNGTVSELAMRRSEYATVLKRDGFQTLVARLDSKIDDLAAGRAQ